MSAYYVANKALWAIVIYLLLTRPWNCGRDYRQMVHNFQSIQTTEVKP